MYNTACLLSSLHAYTLAGFLFNLDQSNICRDIKKIESLIRNCLSIPQKTLPQKTYNITKRLKISYEVEQYFAGFLSFVDSTEQQIPRPINKQRRKLYYSGKKKRHTIKNQLVVNNHGIIIHKIGCKKGRRDMTIIFIKRNHL